MTSKWCNSTHQEPVVQGGPNRRYVFAHKGFTHSNESQAMPVEKKLVCSLTWRELNEPANAAQTYILMACRILRYGNEPSGSMSGVFTFTRSAVVIWTVVGVLYQESC